jgi:hypothetical protein
MEQLSILEKICDNITNSLEPGTAIYIFTAAIYDSWWCNGNKLDENLAKRLISLWEVELTGKMYNAYRSTKYQENRPQHDDYYKRWIENSYKKYNDNNGIRCALRNIWAKTYGIRIEW